VPIPHRPGGSFLLDWQRLRTLTTGATLVVALLTGALPASAETAVQRARHARTDAVREIGQLRRALTRAERDRAHQVPLSGVLLARLGPRLDADRAVTIRTRGRRHDELRQHAWQRLVHRTKARIEMLRDRRDALDAWLGTYGVFEVCPVGAYTEIRDDFGIMVRLPKVPPHRHMGNDISAPTWAPIRAPFDGYASGGRSVLGGIEVRVHGARGYVYNAHLIAYGHLGWVRAGDVVGYVGATGDATAPHDHFEWHPGNGGAVDPHPFLVAACLPVVG
jgi:murein DD-endopeptidase MepM/ murein hydrolase activator NlpD